MRRWLITLGLGGSVLAFACNDDTVEEVDQEVCYSGMRWVGEKRGSPEMFPGRDCVGCHIDNDGPPLALGGTVYPFVLSANTPALLGQSGTDCFGLEGVTVRIDDADGQIFEVVTNRAGNFYVEGNPDDFAKPFGATLIWTNPETGNEQTTPMGRSPSYGGCGRCHNPEQEAVGMDGVDPPDTIVAPVARIGTPGTPAQAEVTLIGCQLDPSLRGCDRVLMDAMMNDDSTTIR